MFLEIVRGKNILRKGVLFKKIVLLGTVSLILILLALYGTGAAADVYGASAKIRIKVNTFLFNVVIVLPLIKNSS